jgi:hypothetical protein
MSIPWDLFTVFFSSNICLFATSITVRSQRNITLDFLAECSVQNIAKYIYQRYLKPSGVKKKPRGWDHGIEHRDVLTWPLLTSQSKFQVFYIHKRSDQNRSVMGPYAILKDSLYSFLKNKNRIEEQKFDLPLPLCPNCVSRVLVTQSLQQLKKFCSIFYDPCICRFTYSQVLLHNQTKEDCVNKWLNLVAERRKRSFWKSYRKNR